MAKYEIEIPNDLIWFFKKYVDDTQPTEILIVQMLKLLREMLKVANYDCFLKEAAKP